METAADMYPYLIIGGTKWYYFERENELFFMECGSQNKFDEIHDKFKNIDGLNIIENERKISVYHKKNAKKRYKFRLECFS